MSLNVIEILTDVDLENFVLSHLNGNDASVFSRSRIQNDLTILAEFENELELDNFLLEMEMFT